MSQNFGGNGAREWWGEAGWMALLVLFIRDSQDATERMCWAWVGVSILLLGIQQYQPDRRFLFLLPPDPTPPEARAVFWNGVILVGALLVTAWPGKFPSRPLRIPVALLIPAFLLLVPLRFAAGLLRPTHTVSDASRALRVMESQLPASNHAMEGELAATLALETGLLTFYRRDKGSNLPLNRNGFTRFQPVFQVVAQALPVRAGE